MYIRPPQISLENLTTDSPLTSTIIYSVAAVSFLTTSILWLSFRLRYPCLTLTELNEKERCLDDTHGMLTIALVLRFARELEDITRRRIDIKKKASQIRLDNLLARSFWKNYLGFHPSLVPDIISWYSDAEELERNILLLVEAGIQHRLETESPVHGLELIGNRPVQ